MQTDPVGYEDQMNLYAYVHNDPLNYFDPSGMQSESKQRQLEEIYVYADSSDGFCTCLFGADARQFVETAQSVASDPHKYINYINPFVAAAAAWNAYSGNKGGDDSISIEDDGSGISIITVDTPSGEVEIIGGISSDGESVTIGSPESGAHIEGPGAGQLGLSGTKEIGRRIGRKYGAKEVKIYGGTRTTGANPGKNPRPITIKVQ